MPFEIRALSDLTEHGFDTIIDVRSPAEYAEDHVPGAISLPVLSDDERARVGTIYVQESAFLARKIGAALVARNAAAHIEGPLSGYDGGWQPLIYCWRGGQRSGAFASILAQIGWRAETLKGGYQSYRRQVVRTLYETDMTCEVVLLDGNTGTGKTDLLKRLPDLGVQVLDLEGMANHRGSALGGQGGQPSQKGFETALAAAIATLDPTRPVVVEAESSMIGTINLPPGLFAAMKAAERVNLEVPVPARAEYLARAYRDVTDAPDDLCARLDKLVRLQGKERVAGWKAMVHAGEFHDLAAELIVHHYDPRYTKVRERGGAGVGATIRAEQLNDSDLDILAAKVADWINARAAPPTMLAPAAR